MAARVSHVDLPEQWGEVISGESIAQFLALENWTCQHDLKDFQVWSQPGVVDSEIASVMVPKNSSFADYARRLEEATSAITSTLNIKLSEFVDKLVAIRADLFFVRLDQDTIDGTIPLQQATELISGIDKLIRAAAMSTYNPHSSGKGRASETVRHFMREDLRMGHTKKGSFIVTVAARHDLTPVTAAPEGEESSQEGHESLSFTRQVMTTLARTLDVTRKHAQRGDDYIDLEAAETAGMKIPLIRALQEISDGEGLKSLDMSFEWSPSEPVETDLPTRVVFDRQVIDCLPDVETRLTKAEEPKEVTVIGQVTSLRRVELPGKDDIDHGEVTVTGDLDGRVRKLLVDLEGDDYDWAIQAHRAFLPFTVSGVLGKIGTSWALVEKVRVDTSFLEHWATANPNWKRDIRPE